MAGIWKRAMDYLGLGDEDPYDDYDAPADADPARSAKSARPSGPPADPEPARVRQPKGGWEEEAAPVRPLPTRTLPSRDLDPVPPRRVTPSDPADPSGLTVRQPARPVQGSTVRMQPPPPPPSGEPYTVRPRRFDQAQEVADKFKEGQPVIMNLESSERDVSRRLIDFASGLCYALNGSMEKVATGVYLLKPASRHSYDDEYD
jgi:cell division inhibitor SepF